MTRIRFAALGPALLACGCVAGRIPPVDLEVEKQTIRARGDAMLAAENARDFATSLAFYAEDAVIQGPGMPAVRGRETIRAMYEQLSTPGAPRTVGAYTGRLVSVAASGELAWEEGTSTTTIETPSGPVVEPGKHLIVWKKLEGEWQVAALAWSGDAPPRDAALPGQGQ